MGLVFASTTQVTRGEALSQLDPMSIISANVLGVDVVAVLLLLFAAVQVGREFRERTAQSYLAASPRRSTYFIAKSLAFGLVSLAVGAAVALAALLDGLLLVSAVGKQAPALAEVCRLAAGSALMPLFYVLLAVSATFCSRSTAAGAAIPFAVLFLPAFAELLPGALRGALVPLLPASAIHTLSGEARIGSAEHTGGPRGARRPRRLGAAARRLRGLEVPEDGRVKRRRSPRPARSQPIWKYCSTRSSTLTRDSTRSSRRCSSPRATSWCAHASMRPLGNTPPAS